MELLIGEKVYELRKKKGVTQEQLAHAVGVSTAAVSKWETGNSYPDITLLAVIARYFNISIDELMSFEKDISKEAVLKIEEEFSDIFKKEGMEEAIEYLERKIKEYPNNNYLKYRGAGILQMHMEAAITEEGRNKIILRAIELTKEVSESNNPELKNYAYALLSTLYMHINDFENAEKALKNIPKVDINPAGILPTVYFMQGNIEEAEKLYQMNLYTGVNNCVTAINGMLNVARKDKNYAKALELLKAQKDLIQIFSLEDIMMLQYFQHLLLTYSDIKEIDKTLEAMEEYLYYINNFDWENYDISKNKFFDKNKTGLHVWKSTFEMKNGLIKELKQNPRYDFVRDTKKYKDIIQ